ncbi:glycoside hydrolase family 36 protein [Streptomyces marincola]|uniref:glycoside hydrolase family 36 protein n=1 Tax=Streptomyces marincola TaxID=2878388 RepID=UPI001CF1988F|nr:glycoside hydrolase family 36 protein [Streptomyces marincola]UCM91369.1 alpha-galactosidase [Streptomyces marincola]
MTARTRLVWQGGVARLTFAVGGDLPVSLLSVRPAGAGEPAAPPEEAAAPPLVELQALGHGRFPGSHRYADTTVGARLRHVGHEESADGTWAELRLTQRDDVSGLVVTSVFRAARGVPAVRAWTEVTLAPGAEEVRLQAVTSVVTGAFLADAGRPVDGMDVVCADSDWVAESRWRRAPLREVGLVAMDPEAHHHASRSRFPVTSRSSWSTGERLPTGAVVAADDSWALAWQIEHNGAWHWELGERRAGAYLALLGPTDAEHQWSTVVTAEAGFTTVPVSLAVAAGGVDEAFGALTHQRRALRAGRSGPLPVVFNDYMNTLMGNPTTAKLLPLIDAAAEAGAEYFCVDAGWYDEDGHWWDSVGEWRPSATRFPGGLGEVVARVRERGMVPGLWLEPEVVGVRSPMAGRLPDEAFFQRHGRRVVEHGRYHLDLRHPAARAHVDGIVDGLVEEFGVGFFKFDYNIMPGAGTDAGGCAPGEGLLAHNRAHLEWLDALLERHPDLLIENCASGAMRMDYAMLSRLHLQSTSDQQNPLLYPPIASAAPASVLPEQAGNWAYTQPEMSVEESAFTLATGVLGRLYLSGHLNRMAPEQLALVRAAVAVHKDLREEIAGALPFWPLGLTNAAGPWVATGLRAPEAGGGTLLTVWRRPGADPELVLPVPHLRGADIRPEVLFPGPGTGAAEWALAWDAERGELRLTSPESGPAATARVIRLR